jgi:hypothetical protein
VNCFAGYQFWNWTHLYLSFKNIPKDSKRWDLLAWTTTVLCNPLASSCQVKIQGQQIGRSVHSSFFQFH